VTADAHFAGFSPCDISQVWQFVCRTVDVPVDRDDPAAGTIPIRVIGLPHRDQSVPEGLPFFATPGGPGTPGVENYAFWKLPALINDHHDMIGIDPRGTGASDVIDCPDLQNGSSSLEEFQIALVACGAQLGPMSDRYGSANRAMDVDDVRQAMGYDSIIYHGQSYAAVDVQAYAARFADRLAVVVLDSGTPINDISGSTFGVDVAQGLLDVAAARCAADAACAASTPDPRAVVEQLVTTLGTSPVTRTASDGSGEVTIDQARIAGFIGDDDASVDVVAAALALAGGDPEPLRTLDARFPRGNPDGDGDATDFSTGANFAGMCNDVPMPYDPSDPVDVRRQKLDAAVAALPDDTYAPWTKAQWSEYEPLDLCLNWPAPHHFEPVMPVGSSFPGIPALIMAGELEPIDAISERLLTVFPDGAYFTVPGVGHNTLSLGECTAEFEAAFIETLTVPDGAPCTPST
jgi:pimeloyl-ACP methyl ester carboxylesterase